MARRARRRHFSFILPVTSSPSQQPQQQLFSDETASGRRRRKKDHPNGARDRHWTAGLVLGVHQLFWLIFRAGGNDELKAGHWFDRRGIRECHPSSARYSVLSFRSPSLVLLPEVCPSALSYVMSYVNMQLQQRLQQMLFCFTSVSLTANHRADALLSRSVFYAVITTT